MINEEKRSRSGSDAKKAKTSSAWITIAVSIGTNELPPRMKCHCLFSVFLATLRGKCLIKSTFFGGGAGNRTHPAHLWQSTPDLKQNIAQQTENIGIYKQYRKPKNILSTGYCQILVQNKLQRLLASCWIMSCIVKISFTDI